jgi:2-methylcitrate dehydratase PrpD
MSAAQFNMPYNISVACHRIPRGGEWSDPGTINNPDIINFMPKVSIKPNPDYDKVMAEDPLSALSKVDIVARGQTFTVERQHRKGTTGTEASATDDDITGKFKHNAERILTKHQIGNAVDALTGIENLEDVTELMDYVTV